VPNLLLGLWFGLFLYRWLRFFLWLLAQLPKLFDMLLIAPKLPDESVIGCDKEPSTVDSLERYIVVDEVCSHEIGDN